MLGYSHGYTPFCSGFVALQSGRESVDKKYFVYFKQIRRCLLDRPLHLLYFRPLLTTVAPSKLNFPSAPVDPFKSNCGGSIGRNVRGGMI